MSMSRSGEVAPASVLQVVACSIAHANQKTLVKLTDAVVTLQDCHAHPTAGVRHCVTGRTIRPPVVKDSHNEQNAN